MFSAMHDIPNSVDIEGMRVACEVVAAGMKEYELAAEIATKETIVEIIVPRLVVVV